jgi:FecR protein
MYRNKFLLGVILIYSFTSVLHAQVSATLVDFDGEVMISRNGEFLSEYEIDFGLELYTYDILQTGRDGYAEIEITSPVSSEISVKVMASSTLNLEHRVKSNGGETSINLHRGSVQARAATLIRGGNFNIKTQSSIMGVRGTTFTVSTTPDDSLLVSCREGEVSCSSSGSDSLIQPGKIYEAAAGDRPRTVPVSAENIDSFTEEWKSLKFEALLIDGALSLENYSVLYLKSAPKFLDAYDEIIAQKEIFMKWEKIAASGSKVSTGDAVRDKMAVNRGIIALRSSLPMMRKTYFTLYDLIYIMDNSNVKWRDLSSTAEKTVTVFKKNQEDYFEMITLAQYFFKLYIEMDRQSSPFKDSDDMDFLSDFLTDTDF